MSVHIFDLDKTIWDCFDKFGNSIWAKQLLPPFSLSESIVLDDVQNTCHLRAGVKEYMYSFQQLCSKFGYCSV